jgi:replication-associated recombination protein RarA
MSATLKDITSIDLETNTVPVPGTNWPDRYRPDDLRGMALAPEVRRKFEWYLAGKCLPRSVILHGPPGFGKTTIAKIIARTLYSGTRVPRYLMVKVPEGGGVEMVRDQVIGYMRGASLFGGGGKLVILEEAERLSPEAMKALRIPLEEYYDLCRVIFTTNDLAKLDAAVRSRCDVVSFERPPHDECARVLGEVLKKEGKGVAPEDVLAFTNGHFGEDADHDLRSLLATAQGYVESGVALPVPSIPPQVERARRLEVRISAQADHLFRSKLIARFGAS